MSALSAADSSTASASLSRLHAADSSPGASSLRCVGVSDLCVNGAQFQLRFGASVAITGADCEPAKTTSVFSADESNVFDSLTPDSPSWARRPNHFDCAHAMNLLICETV